MELKEKRTELWLEDLEDYNPITIQCHDNPDADAIASGYGLYCYFQSKGKDVSLVYSGRNQIQKSNLVLMRDMLKIPVGNTDRLFSLFDRSVLFYWIIFFS